jgi:hypothetical protein
MLLLDLAGGTYSQIMAVVNFICFGSLCGCAAYVFVAVVLGHFSNQYKRYAMSALVAFGVLLIIHFTLLEHTGITLLVPPVDTPYFTAFIHVIQYLASISVVVLAAATFLMAVLSRLDKAYHHGFVNGVIYLIILAVIHWYVFDNFGIQIIFPPTLW